MGRPPLMRTCHGNKGRNDTKREFTVSGKLLSSEGCRGREVVCPDDDGSAWCEWGGWVGGLGSSLYCF